MRVLDLTLKTVSLGVLTLVAIFMLNALNIHPEGKVYKYSVNSIAPHLGLNRINDTLRIATERDTVEIYIASRGGELSLTRQLIYDIEQSKAHVKTIVAGDASSAAAILTFAGDSILIEPEAQIMFHLMRYAKEVIPPLNNPAQIRFISLIMNYGGQYLTENEIFRLLIGQDVRILDMHKRILKPKKGHTVEKIQELIKGAKVINAVRYTEYMKSKEIKDDKP